MNYEIEGGTHALVMGKDELLTLVSLVYKGLEDLREGAKRGDALAAGKYEAAQAFVNEFGRAIMAGGPEKDV